MSGSSAARWHSPARRWDVPVANERGGYSRRLPDLVFWPTPDDTRPVAVVVVHGPPKPRRDRAAHRGWQHAIPSRQYAQVRYLARPAATSQLEDIAAQIGLTATQLIVGDLVVTGDPPAPTDVVEQFFEGPAPAPAEPAPPAAPDTPRPAPPHPLPGARLKHR